MADTARFEIERCEALAGVPHGFFGSAGGAHQFGYGGPGAAAAIAALRAAAAEAICAGGRLVAPHQVHSAMALRVDQAWDDTPEGRPVADAMVTATPGIVLGIITADCAPVLLADREAGVIGAAHAGWRGAADGVIEACVAQMAALGARREAIVAAIGPTIAQPSYEVDEALRSRFSEAEARFFADAPWRDGAARWHFDLPGLVAARLRDSGLAEIINLGRDTFAEIERYHSHRRSTHACEPGYGRQISMIALA